MSMPESVRDYLELLVDTYSGKTTPKPREVADAWDAVPLDWRMRIHEQCDFEAHEDILAGARKMLGLDEVPELDESFFERAILTRPGESVLEAVQPVTLESVQNYEMESPDTHTGPVPKMPRSEREAWHRLTNKRLASRSGGPRLTLDEGKLLTALNRSTGALPYLGSRSPPSVVHQGVEGGRYTWSKAPRAGPRHRG